MRPALEERRIREATRSVNVYLSAARNRAIENQRPWGVAVLRDGNMALAGTRLIQVEVPTPYAGDTTNTSVSLSWDGMVNAQGIATVTANRSSGSTSGGLIRIGDQVQINYRPPVYEIKAAASVDADGFVRASPSGGVDPDGFPLTLQVYLGRDASGNPIASLPWPSGGSAAVPFQIIRQPVTSSVPPLQLPRNVVVDLWYSGSASTQFSTASIYATDSVILFSSTGAVDRIFALGGVYRGTEPVYLLVGRRDRVYPSPAPGQLDATGDFPSVAEDRLTNLGDLLNLWVAVNPQTGYITSAEMAQSNVSLPLAQKLNAARDFARDFQSMGGR